MELWTFEDQEKAFKEGWGVFLVDGRPDKSEIQKLDKYTGSCPLDTDLDAIDWVMRVASKGEHLHEKALAVCNLNIEARHPWDRVVRVEICFWRSLLIRFYTLINLEISHSTGSYKREYPTQQQMNFLMIALKNMNFVARVDVENHMVIYEHPSLVRKPNS